MFRVDVLHSKKKERKARFVKISSAKLILWATLSTQIITQFEQGKFR